MGWASGSILMGHIIDEIERIEDPELSKELKIKIYYILICEFEAEDCDTLDECLGDSQAYDEAFNKEDTE